MSRTATATAAEIMSGMRAPKITRRGRHVPGRRCRVGVGRWVPRTMRHVRGAATLGGIGRDPGCADGDAIIKVIQLLDHGELVAEEHAHVVGVSAATGVPGAPVEDAVEPNETGVGAATPPPSSGRRAGRRRNRRGR